MILQFAKYSGLGNDFIVLDGVAVTPEQARGLCHRHNGVGADGVLIRTESSKANHKMILFNSDGSFAEISGNGLRCFALFLKDSGYDVSKEFSVETGGGVMQVRVMDDQTVETTMPLPDFASMKTLPDPFQLSANGEMFSVLPVNVGNPHGVIFGDERDLSFAKEFGPSLETNQVFPNRANIQFAHAVNDHECKLVTWERGAGITLACGSGSVATACAGAALGFFSYDTPIAIVQPGGTLTIVVGKGFQEIRQRGTAGKIFEGSCNLK